MIYLFLASGFEEIEALAPVDMLRRAELPVATVGVGGKTITGAHGVAVTADLTEDELDFSAVEMVVLPGGPGTPNLERSAAMKQAVLACAQAGKPLAAICAAPSILGHMGLLKGHRATCFPGYEQELGAAQATGEPVCVSGNIITARGAGVAVEFALEIVRFLQGPEKSLQLRKKIQCT